MAKGIYFRNLVYQPMCYIIITLYEYMKEKRKK